MRKDHGESQAVLVGDYHCGTINYSGRKCFRDNKGHGSGTSNSNLQLAGRSYYWVCGAFNLKNEAHEESHENRRKMNYDAAYMAENFTDY